MILLYYPKLTKPKNRRFPLSIMALAAVLEGREEYEIVDGNLDPEPDATLIRLMKTHSVELLGVSVMPRPADGFGDALLPCGPRAVSECSHRMGRVFSFSLSRRNAESQGMSIMRCGDRAKTRCLS